MRNLIVSLLTSAILCASNSALAQSPKYRIGAIVVLSGEAAIFGRAAQNGMKLAIDDLDAADRSRIEIVYEDDGMQPARSVSAFRKLVDVDKVNAVVCWSSSTCKAVAPLAERSKTPLIAIASDAAVSKGRKFAFNFWVTPEDTAMLLVKEAVSRGYKRVAAVSATHEGALATRDAFVQAAKGKIEIVYDEHFPSDSQDLRTHVARIATLKPDAIMLSMMPGNQGLFVKQLREGNVVVPLFGFEAMEDKGSVTASAGGMIGAWFVTAATAQSGFMNKYIQRFPNDSAITASNGYDAVTLLSNASSKDPSGTAVATFLAEVKNQTGASGTFSATGDNRFSLPVTLKEITSQGFVPLKQQSTP